MAKKTKLIALCGVVVGNGEKAVSVDPGSIFEIDSGEAEGLIAAGAARLSTGDAEAKAKAEADAKAAAEKAAEADRFEAERLVAEEAARRQAQGTLT